MNKWALFALLVITIMFFGVVQCEQSDLLIVNEVDSIIEEFVISENISNVSNVKIKPQTRSRLQKILLRMKKFVKSKAGAAAEFFRINNIIEPLKKIKVRFYDLSEEDKEFKEEIEGALSFVSRNASCDVKIEAYIDILENITNCSGIYSLRYLLFERAKKKIRVLVEQEKNRITNCEKLAVAVGNTNKIIEYQNQMLSLGEKLEIVHELQRELHDQATIIDKIVQKKLKIVAAIVLFLTLGIVVHKLDNKHGFFEKARAFCAEKFKWPLREQYRLDRDLALYRDKSSLANVTAEKMLKFRMNLSIITAEATSKFRMKLFTIIESIVKTNLSEASMFKDVVDSHLQVFLEVLKEVSENINGAILMNNKTKKTMLKKNKTKIEEAIKNKLNDSKYKDFKKKLTSLSKINKIDSLEKYIEKTEKIIKREQAGKILENLNMIYLINLASLEGDSSKLEQSYIKNTILGKQENLSRVITEFKKFAEGSNKDLDRNKTIQRIETVLSTYKKSFLWLKANRLKHFAKIRDYYELFSVELFEIIELLKKKDFQALRQRAKLLDKGPLFVESDLNFGIYESV